jgi:hypothetical protein
VEEEVMSMHNRRTFLNMAVAGAGAACLAARAAAPAAAENASPLPKRALLDVLEAAGKPAQVVTNSDGTEVVLLPYGGRVLGLYARASDENFYWTHPALRSVETAKAFYAGGEWHNSGGDRTWLAPEVDIFLPAFPDTKAYVQPRALDPGDYRVVRSSAGMRLVNHLKLKLSRSGQEVSLRVTKSVGPAPNPLRYERDLDLGGVAYAGYTQRTRLELLGPRAKEAPAVGLWNLVQMPHGGDMLIPTYSRTEPTVWFGRIAAEDLLVGDRLICYRMRAEGEHKLGVRAVATAGRVGYRYGAGTACALIVRNFLVNPSGEYVDVPWKSPNDLGYSTQACNVKSALGAFSELEYHIPAIGGSAGSVRGDDAAQVWAFRGPEERIRAVARRLLSPDI